MTQENSLLQQILSGQNRQLQLLAAQGLVPLPPEQLLPIQVALTRSPDGEIAQHATAALDKAEPNLTATFLAEIAGADELHYFGTRSTDPKILEAIVRRRDVPRPVLVEMARRLGPELQETLILRQDAILEEPQILVALESNPQISNYAKRRIWEYREHLLPREKVPPKTAEEIEKEAEELTEEEIEEAIAEVTEGGEGEEDDEQEPLDDLSRLNEGQIRGLPVPIRMRLARGANRQLRSILIRDTNSQVALSVIRSNPLTEQEVEAICNSKAVVDDVLMEISRQREWTKKYSIVKALARNPKTQLPTALRFVARLTARDLRAMARDRNVAAAVRAQALRLYQQKQR